MNSGITASPQRVLCYLHVMRASSIESRFVSEHQNDDAVFITIAAPLAFENLAKHFVLSYPAIVPVIAVA